MSVARFQSTNVATPVAQKPSRAARSPRSSAARATAVDSSMTKWAPRSRRQPVSCRGSGQARAVHHVPGAEQDGRRRSGRDVPARTQDADQRELRPAGERQHRQRTRLQPRSGRTPWPSAPNDSPYAPVATPTPRAVRRTGPRTSSQRGRHPRRCRSRRAGGPEVRRAARRRAGRAHDVRRPRPTPLRPGTRAGARPRRRPPATRARAGSRHRAGGPPPRSPAGSRAPPGSGRAARTARSARRPPSPPGRSPRSARRRRSRRRRHRSPRPAPGASATAASSTASRHWSRASGESRSSITSAGSRSA